MTICRREGCECGEILRAVDIEGEHRIDEEENQAGGRRK